MKTISLRTFRVTVDRLTEPVQVAKREDGGIRVLGTWTPLNVPQAIHDATTAWRGRPAPKPGK